MDVQKVFLINLKKIVLSLTGGALIGIGAGTILYASIGGILLLFSRMDCMHYLISAMDRHQESIMWFLLYWH